MSRLATTGTRPERALRSELHRRGLRFRVNVRGMPGRPDIVFSRARLAVQVDGCFWHGCPDHGTRPKANAEWWNQKIDANRERDSRSDRLLHEQGWLVLRVWEHEDVNEAADRIEVAWRARTDRRPVQD